MVDPPWMPRTEEEYRQQLAEDEAEEIGEMLERRRQTENQPTADDWDDWDDCKRAEAATGATIMASDERARRMAQIDYRLTAESYFGDEARGGVPWLLGTLEQANARIAALEAEVARLVVREAVLERAIEKAADWHSLPPHEFEGKWGRGWEDSPDADGLIAADLRAALAALAARGGEERP